MFKKGFGDDESIIRKKIIPHHKSCRGTTVAHCHAFQNQYDCGAAAGDAVVDPWTDCYHQLLLGHSSWCTRDVTSVCQDMPSVVVVGQVGYGGDTALRGKP